jgi:hypothetical protein
LYVNEVLGLRLEGYVANYGSLSRETCKNNPGTVPVIFGAGSRDGEFGETILTSKKIVREYDGLGKTKLVVSKNGNRGVKSPIKFAGPDVALGHTALWIEVKNQNEFKKIHRVWNNEPCYDKLVCILKETSPANGIEFWQQVPNIKYLEKINAIYDNYYKSNSN